MNQEPDKQETDCKCGKDSPGWTTVKCCNLCGKSIEPFWKLPEVAEQETLNINSDGLLNQYSKKHEGAWKELSQSPPPEEGQVEQKDIMELINRVRNFMSAIPIDSYRNVYLSHFDESLTILNAKIESLENKITRKDK